MNIADFYNLHKGQTCLICGVGPNLSLTPPNWFDYPSFGVNTIFRTPQGADFGGWKPTYFVGVDDHLQRRYGDDILAAYPDVPKFIPYPDRDSWHGPNFYRFYHRAGEVIWGGHHPNRPNGLVSPGLGYRRIMDAVLQIAWYMGFTTMLMIGISHKPNTRQDHFWGFADYDPTRDFVYEEMGYSEVSRAMGAKVKVLNISEDTYVPADVLPRDDWQKWSNVYEAQNA